MSERISEAVGSHPPPYHLEPSCNYLYAARHSSGTWYRACIEQPHKGTEIPKSINVFLVDTLSWLQCRPTDIRILPPQLANEPFMNTYRGSLDLPGGMESREFRWEFSDLVCNAKFLLTVQSVVESELFPCSYIHTVNLQAVNNAGAVVSAKDLIQSRLEDAGVLRRSVPSTPMNAAVPAFVPSRPMPQQPATANVVHQSAGPTISAIHGTQHVAVQPRPATTVQPQPVAVQPQPVAVQPQPVAVQPQPLPHALPAVISAASQDAVRPATEPSVADLAPVLGSAVALTAASNTASPPTVVGASTGTSPAASPTPERAIEEQQQQAQDAEQQQQQDVVEPAVADVPAIHATSIGYIVSPLCVAETAPAQHPPTQEQQEIHEEQQQQQVAQPETQEQPAALPVQSSGTSPAGGSRIASAHHSRSNSTSDTVAVATNCPPANADTDSGALLIREPSPETVDAEAACVEGGSAIADLSVPDANSSDENNSVNRASHDSGHPYSGVSGDSSPVPSFAAQDQALVGDAGKVEEPSGFDEADLVHEILQEGASLNVTIEHGVDERGYFWPQLTELEESDDFVTMMEDLNAADVTATPIAQDSAVEGNYCLARYSVDDRWYRGLIEAVFQEEQEVLLRFLDYGNSERVHISRLMEIPERAYTIPLFSFECSLSGVDAETLTEKQMNAFMDAVADVEVSVKVVSIADYHYYVDVIKTVVGEDGSETQVDVGQLVRSAKRASTGSFTTVLGLELSSKDWSETTCTPPSSADITNRSPMSLPSVDIAGPQQDQQHHHHQQQQQAAQVMPVTVPVSVSSEPPSGKVSPCTTATSGETTATSGTPDARSECEPPADGNSVGARPRSAPGQPAFGRLAAGALTMAGAPPRTILQRNKPADNTSAAPSQGGGGGPETGNGSGFAPPLPNSMSGGGGGGSHWQHGGPGHQGRQGDYGRGDRYRGNDGGGGGHYGRSCSDRPRHDYPGDGNANNGGNGSTSGRRKGGGKKKNRRARSSERSGGSAGSGGNYSQAASQGSAPRSGGGGSQPPAAS
ncbi:uncharacterized protein LOC135822959 [Sycon ciliatum]|uniref:uncharacterized protein LOC135822959 n=1 Tax=Sycon ciliatum TaxID=27933 RepID=UPI0031F69E1A